MNTTNESEIIDKNKTQVKKIIEIVSVFKPFKSQLNEYFVEIDCEMKSLVFLLNGSFLKDYISEKYILAYESLPEPKSVERVIDLLIHRAKQAETKLVFSRIARIENRIFVDLGRTDFPFVEITDTGWCLQNEVPVKFYRPNNMKELSIPKTGGKITDLKKFVNISNDENFILLISFLIGAFYHNSEYPILILQGPQGSAKSTLSNIIKELIDPGLPLLRSLSEKESDLFIAAKNSHLLCFDNLSGISTKISDTICKVSTGCGFSTRKLYTDSDEHFIEVSRPIVINGIDSISERQDLVDRAIILNLEKIDAENRKSSGEIRAGFSEKKGQILGSIFDGLVFALKNRGKIESISKTRMVDFYYTICAALVGLGYSIADIEHAFELNKNEKAIDSIESSSIGTLVKSFMHSQDYWAGSSTDLFLELKKVDQENPGISLLLSKSISSFSKDLNRIAPALFESGILLDRQRTKDKRLIILSKKDLSPASPSS